MNTRTMHGEHRTPDQVAEAASFWDARLRSPNCTDEDRATFTAWREADPAHRAAFERLQAVITTLRAEMGRADVRALRDAALRAVNRRRQMFLAIAASAALLTFAVLLWSALPDSMRQGSWSRVASIASTLRGLATPAVNHYATGIGQQSTITLADGSTVELDAKSQINVGSEDARRTVELVSGQALFRVTKNPNRPFIVRAANRQVVALGTAFDVRLDARSVRVTLLEGKVRVDSREAREPVKPLDQEFDHGSRQVSQKGVYRHDEHSSTTETLLRGYRGGPNANNRETPDSKKDSSGTAVFLAPGQQLIARLPFTHDREAREGKEEVRTAGSAVGGINFGEAVNASEGGEGVSVRNIDVDKVTAWRTGRVFLEDLDLPEAIAEMNRYSAIQITVTDPALMHLRVNGMFRAGQQGAFAQALQDYFPIRAERHSETQIVLTARK
jgi:ferric-dicitrate binding protein FerR (iron transport regulator)